MEKKLAQLLEVCNILRVNFGGDFIENHVWFVSKDLNTTLQDEFGFNEPVLNFNGKEISTYAGIWIHFGDFNEYSIFDKLLAKNSLTRIITQLYYFGPFGYPDSVLVSIPIHQ